MRNHEEYLKELGKDELIELIQQAQKKLSTMRTITLRIMEKVHGYDYIYATWTDERGKAHQKSLGRLFSSHELKELAKMPRPTYNDCRLPEKQALELQKKYEESWSSNQDWSPPVNYHVLSDNEFLEMYEIEPHEDKMGRPRKVWYNMLKLQSLFAKWEENQKVSIENKWRGLGVGTIKGVSWLNRMESEGHTIITQGGGVVASSNAH